MSEIKMDFLDILNTYEEEMLKTLAESVSMESVGSGPVQTKEGEVLPFGKGVNDALTHMLKKGSELGFDVCNVDNYAGHIEWKSEDPEKEKGYFGIPCHLDVVPVGTGWSGKPFELRDPGDGFVYGRGVSDNKGPLVACLYAMKALKEAGVMPHTDIRLVLGLDEETGRISVDRYIEDMGNPNLGFTPDGVFPIVNGEMGIMIFDLAQKFTHRATKDGIRLTRLEGGTAPNAVPAYAKAVIAADAASYEAINERLAQYADETGYTIKSKKQGSSLVIEAEGKAAHGSKPWLGLNAISILMGLLERISFTNEELNEFIEFCNEHIGFDMHGERIGCDLEDEVSGKLIFNTGVVNINEEFASVTANIRYPISFTEEMVAEGIKNEIEDSRVGMVSVSGYYPIFMELDDPFVVKLLEAYRTETGDSDSKPIIEGGSTYAKLFDNVICFGALFPGEESSMHQTDERMSKESFMKMARIFARAIYSVTCNN